MTAFGKDEYRIVDELNNFFNRAFLEMISSSCIGSFLTCLVHPLYVRLGRLLKVFVENPLEGEDALKAELHRVERLVDTRRWNSNLISIVHRPRWEVVVDYEKGTKAWKEQNGDREERVSEFSAD